MTRFGRDRGTDAKALVQGAFNTALADAALDACAIGSVFFANATQGHVARQLMICGQIAMRSMGISGIPVFNVENGCTGGSSALQLGVTALKAGDADVALAVGTEKMVYEEKAFMF